MSKVICVDDALDLGVAKLILKTASNASEESWNEMNEPQINGEFWSGKRLMINPLLGFELEDVLIKMNLKFSNTSATNKVQRFNQGDILGPLKDSAHVPNLMYGSVLFLNNSSGGIEFPDLDIRVDAKQNSLVVYPADTCYLIRGSSSKDYMYFTTVFLD